ncbi:hypothetical protein GGF32_000581 [Allomyces javanicus]|nr:hypothetical protein GGF32_000581 [Allomyces javanicus]
MAPTCDNVDSHCGSSSPPALPPRLDTLPFDLVLAIGKHLLNRTHRVHDDPPQQERPVPDTSHDLIQLAHAAPNCFLPAVSLAVHHVHRFYLVNPSPHVPGACIVTSERPLPRGTTDLAGSIVLDQDAPLVATKDGVVRRPMSLVLAGSLEDGIPAHMAVRFPVTAIRSMTVVDLPWMLDYAVPPHLVTLAVKGVLLDATRARVFATHLPTTLLRLSLDAVRMDPADMRTLVSRIPPSVRDVSIVDVPLDDDTTEVLAHAILPRLTHLQLVSTGMTSRGFMAVMAALPADQLRSLTLGCPLHLKTAMVLAAWLATTTRLTHLGLDHTYTATAPDAMEIVLAALPATICALKLPGSLYSATPLATAMARFPNLDLLDVSDLQGPPLTLADLITSIPSTTPLRVLRMAHIDLFDTDLTSMLYDVDRPWFHLLELDLRCAQMTLEAVVMVLDALERLLSPYRGKGPRPRVLVEGNLVSTQMGAFRAIRDRWAKNGWEIVP